MKFFGYAISVIGVISFVYTGINYMNNSETFGLLGMDIAVSKGDPMPVILSLVVIVIGVIIARLANHNPH